MCHRFTVVSRHPDLTSVVFPLILPSDRAAWVGGWAGRGRLFGRGSFAVAPTLAPAAEGATCDWVPSVTDVGTRRSDLCERHVTPRPWWTTDRLWGGRRNDFQHKASIRLPRARKTHSLRLVSGTFYSYVCTYRQRIHVCLAHGGVVIHCWGPVYSWGTTRASF